MDSAAWGRAGSEARLAPLCPQARRLEFDPHALPPVEGGWEQHLCLDKGYDDEAGWGACVDHDYEPHIALIWDERLARPRRHKPRWWVVERAPA